MNNEPIDAEYTETKAVATVQPAALPPMLRDLSQPGALDRAVEQMEKLIEYKDRVMQLCVKRAKPGDICNLNDKPHFTEQFCEQVMSRLGGGTIQILEKSWEDHGDGHWGYCVTCRVTIDGLGTSDGIGMATTRDQFLGSVQAKVYDRDQRRKVAKTDAAGNPVLTREIDEVSRHNILQHARTRAVGKALRNILGLNSYTWEELEAWGFAREASTAVAYDGKGATKSTASGSKARLMDFINRKAFTWPQVSATQKELGLDGKAMELSEGDMAKLVDALAEKEAAKS